MTVLKGLLYCSCFSVVFIFFIVEMSCVLCFNDVCCFKYGASMMYVIFHSDRVHISAWCFNDECCVHNCCIISPPLFVGMFWKGLSMFDYKNMFTMCLNSTIQQGSSIYPVIFEEKMVCAIAGGDVNALNCTVGIRNL